MYEIRVYTRRKDRSIVLDFVDHSCWLHTAEETAKRYWLYADVEILWREIDA